MPTPPVRPPTRRASSAVPEAKTKAKTKAAAMRRASAPLPDDAADATGDTARDRILRAAHTLFYGEGVRATGIDRVIAEAGVTKVTFYRHFPSKHALVLAYLALRHASWMAWFTAALARHGGDAAALPAALGEWFKSERFRGCAFINAVGELGEAFPDVRELARRHKADMSAAIAAALPPATAQGLSSRDRQALSDTVAMAVDGAIVQVQGGVAARVALRQLEAIIAALCGPR